MATGSYQWPHTKLHSRGTEVAAQIRMATHRVLFSTISQNFYRCLHPEGGTGSVAGLPRELQGGASSVSQVTALTDWGTDSGLGTSDGGTGRAVRMWTGMAGGIQAVQCTSGSLSWISQQQHWTWGFDSDTGVYEYVWLWVDLPFNYPSSPSFYSLPLCLEAESYVHQLTSNSLCSQGWHWTSDPSDSPLPIHRWSFGAWCCGDFIQ